MLEDALYLADKGLPVFPCRFNSKLPLIPSFSREATTDPEKIRNWWTDPVTGMEQPHNIGIATDKLTVVDVDNKDENNITNPRWVLGQIYDVAIARDFIETYSNDDVDLADLDW